MQNKTSKNKASSSRPVEQTGSAVGLSGPNLPTRHWYIAIVGNNTERACGERLQKLFTQWKIKEGKDCDVYVPIQKETRRWQNGKRVEVERVILPTLVFIRCTELERRKDIAYIPYIKRFFLNISGSPVDGHRPVARIPDVQVANLRRMIEGAETPVSICARPLHLGERVRVNGGKLVGLEGNVLSEDDGSTHLVIKIDILGCAMVKIARDLLDPVS